MTSAAVDWSRVKALFTGALERPAGERAAFLALACGEDGALRGEVESLLASHELAEARDFIGQPTGPLEARPEPAWEGRRIGPYRLLAEVGRGGMGAVFRAVRDGEYLQEVAIKIVERGLDPSLAWRLKSERQILAGLEHPGIARLLDGGTTDDSQPYLVMEFVQGEILTDYVEGRRLSVPERLRLFRGVCAAVHYAHQKLVVHRDIKPGNILVTSEGVPKLLDFGLASLLASDVPESAPTVTLLRRMTPEYASPEQVRGLAISTASDVYSLGVLLCEILTGKRPYRFASRDPAEMARVIAAAPPDRPSALLAQRAIATGPAPRQLRGDLDNIVLMALRKEPERRYASVDQLSEDVRRHLEGLPVIARPDTLGYRTSKFVGRNRGLVAGAVALGLSLVVGLLATLWQAREARRERVRAELRFEDVRALANSVLFEFHDAIARLPGSTPARELLVTRGLEYLDRLAREGGDAALQRELARGYVRLGDLQGQPNSANLGNSRGALTSYRKAEALARAAAAADPRDPGARQDVVTVLHHIGTLLADSEGDLQGALAAEHEAQVLGEAGGGASSEIDREATLLGINTKLGDILMTMGKPSEALLVYKKGLPRYEAMAALTGKATERFNVCVAHAKIGDALMLLDRDEAALESYERMQHIIRALVEGDANDARMRRTLAVSLNKVGRLLEKMGKGEGAVARYRESLSLRQTLVAADPNNTLARLDLVGSYVRIGDLLARSGDDRGALAEYRKAVPILEPLAARDVSSHTLAADLAGVVVRIADARARQGAGAEALAAYRQARPAFEALLATDTRNASSRLDMAVVEAGHARIEAQLASEKGLAATARAHHWREARASYARSLTHWREIGDLKTMDAHFDVASVAESLRAAEAGLARCDGALGGPPAR